MDVAMLSVSHLYCDGYLSGRRYRKQTVAILVTTARLRRQDLVANSYMYTSKILERRKKLRFNLISPSLFTYCNVLGSAHPQNLLYSVESQPSATFPCNLITH